MSLNTTPYEEDILTRLGTACPRVYDTEVPDSVGTPKTPYVLVRWLEPVRSGTDRHMVGVRNDGMRGGAIISCVSSTSADARRLKNVVKPLLVGYRPPDCGELIPEGGMAYSSANAELKPTTYTREMYFTFATNLSSNDAPSDILGEL